MRRALTMKIFVFLKYLGYYALGSIFMLIILYKSANKKIQSKPYKAVTFGIQRYASDVQIEKKNNDMKIFYILQWTSDKTVPFVYMGKGTRGFKKRKCPHSNCFLTSNRSHLEDLTKFDAIIFAGPEVVRYDTDLLPQQRLPHQKYVFASIESAGNYPLCSNRFDNFFNWTWTYKLDSDVRWGYIIIKDAKGNVVGPNKEMHWMKKEEMEPVSDSLKKILRGKTKTAAWFASNCFTPSSREVYVDQLKKILFTKYNITIDVYGSCGPLICPRDTEEQCDEMIKKDYYFYLAFENAFSTDYVTEKLLHAVEYNAVPVVFGGANYSRFLPEGSYLDAVQLGFEQLAAKMNESIHDFKKYSDYFRWTRYYSYHKKNSDINTNDLCSFCALLNDEAKRKQVTIYDKFSDWWDESLC